MRIKLLALTLTVVTLLIALGGCSLLGLGNAPAGPLEIEMTGTVGAAFNVVLAGNPSTGYLWEVELNPAAVKLLNEEYVANPATEGTPGAGGKYRFTFEPQRTGETTMIFRYQRAGDAEPNRMLVYHLKVS